MKTVPFIHDHPRSRFSPKLVLRTALALFGLASSGVSLASARTEGSGRVVTENRQVSAVHAVELRGFGDLEIVQGETEGLTLSGEDNILPLVATEVDDKGTLHIGFKKSESVTTKEKLKFNLTVKSLDGLELSGSGNVHARELNGKGTANLNVSLQGSGNVALDKVEAGALSVSLAGSGSVKIAGEIPAQKVEIAGSGDYEAAKLKSKTATVSVNGSGDVEVWATDSLDVTVNGSGDVEYRGKPDLQKHVHGSGSVEPMAEKES